MSSTQHQLIEQCATRLRDIVEALDNIHDTSPQRWSTDLDDVHSSAESLLAMINDQASNQAALAQPSPAEDMSAAQELAGVKAILNDMADALKRLTFHARTTGGTAGPDAALMNACERAERVLSLGGMGAAFMRGCDDHEAKSEQAEAERPEVVGYRSGTSGGIYADGYGLEKPEPLMTVAQHERIVEARWNRAMDLMGEHVARISEKFKAERDAALARVAGLELGIARIAGDFLPDNSGQAELALDEMRQALHELLAAAPTQAQHSVPEGWMLVPVEQLLNMMSDKDHDTRIMAERQLLAVLAAAPGKEVPQAWLDVQAERKRQVEVEGWPRSNVSTEQRRAREGQAMRRALTALGIIAALGLAVVGLVETFPIIRTLAAWQAGCFG
ncbi:hypothetical protein HX134_12530 [Pseudomonas aeruginosa]|uniref:hypothetical protein n=1 Tax=Pseudomonas aeruginosa TaxID=287 RepID=UPI0025754847|nr:hypothetical protein [Pseudomonas aeruginosa]MDM1424835.1 hypothetical protein [Pseudomonas aeruginosa]